jgi:hypothetical protein
MPQARFMGLLKCGAGLVLGRMKEMVMVPNPNPNPYLVLGHE